MTEWWGAWSAYDYYVLGAIILLTLCSILTRCGYALLGDRLPLSDRVRRALRYAPAAALVAIIVPEVLPWAAGSGPSVNLGFFALAAGVLIYLRTHSTLGLIIGGMVCYWVLLYVAR